MDTNIILLLFVFMLSAFLGFELISKVPSTLHTPLMSGTNAISGITLVGAFLSSGSLTQVDWSIIPRIFQGLANQAELSTFLGSLAVIFATINVVGGYLITHKMLSLFRKSK